MLQNYKRTIVFFTCAILSTQCLATSQNYAQIKAIPRGSSVHLTTGSRITNTPYGYYIPSFGNMKIESVKHVNLSKYANKKILIGYGIYDINNQYCKYLDVPSNSTFDLDFADRMVYGNQTFGISRNPMTFTQCRALVAKYNGYIYTPNTAAQMYYVYNAFNKTGIKNMWLGYHRVSCTQPYLNGQRFQQSYTNLLPKTTTCNANDLDTYVHSTNAQDYFWTRTNGDKKFYCPIMIDSPNYLRPIKVCLPWWKIQREWEIPKSKFNPDVFKFNGHTYNFSYAKYLIDYPLTRIVCTVPAPKALQAYQQGASFQETCRSYESMKQSPSCMYDINKPVCKVNECYGYIQDHCTPEPSKDITLSGVKNYQYGYIMVHGVRERVKVIQNIKIHMYKCTPPPPLESQCKQFEKVKVFPKTCPDSNQCSQLATCLKNDVTTSQQCQAEYKCVKTYGSVDNPVYTNGVLSGFRGICPDGKTVIAPVQRLYSGTSKCLAYNRIKDTNTTIKTCVSHATSTKETVSTAITTKDIYQSNPRCIRTNNMAEAEPAVHMVFQYTNEGFMNTDIQKVYINGHKQDNTSLTPTNYLDDSTSMVNSKYSQNGTAIKASRVSPTYSSLTTLWNNAFLMHDQSKSKTITLNIPAYSDLQVQSSNHNSCDDENVITGTYINGKSTFTAHCKKIPGPPLMTGWVTAYDNHLNSKSIKVTFKAYTEHVSSAKSKASSESTFKYRIATGKPMPKTIKHSFNAPPITMLKSGGSFVGSCNGYSNIYAIENYTNGAFGYVSNYEFKLPLDNIVKINGKEVAPIVDQTPINYHLSYKYSESMHNQSVKNENPTIVRGSISGIRGKNVAISNLYNIQYAGSLLYTVLPLDIYMMFQGTYHYGWFFGNYKVYNTLVPPYTKYVPNPYGYDPRYLEKEKGVFDGNFIWESQKYGSGTLPLSGYLKAEENWQNFKYDNFLNMGFSQAIVNNFMTSSFKNKPYTFWASFKWYDISGKKTVQRSLAGSPNITKKINTIYMGAVNQLSIIVPYIGNYVVTAYDASGEKLGQVTVERENFISNKQVTNANGADESVAQSYAKVEFGIAKDFNVVGGHTRTLEGKAFSSNVSNYNGLENSCLASNFVEWGGGVSGAYYEQGVPDLPKGFNNCAKSNNDYVKLHSATTITVRATNQAKGFTIHLIKPMPWANRTYLVTLNKLANRDYLCWSKLKPCPLSDANTTIPSNVPTISTVLK